MKTTDEIGIDQTQAFIERVFGQDLHAKQVGSVANGALGVLRSEVLGIHAVGRALAAARGLNDKHAVKQVDRLIGNSRITTWDLFAPLAEFLVADRQQVRINLDWTDFEPDGQTMLVALLQTNHGRATPLAWLTVKQSELKNRRNEYEDRLLQRLRDIIPRDVDVTIVADRGFGDHKLVQFLTKLGFGYMIRFKQAIHVHANGETRSAKDWLRSGGRMCVLRHAEVTMHRQPVPTVVCVHAPGMKEPWCIWASSHGMSGQDIVKCYGKRFSCEETFRDVKDLRFGLGMSWTHVRTPERRDRMMLLAVVALLLLTLLGAAGEDLGYDKRLKTNTSPKRQLSLVRQGARWLQLLTTLRPELKVPLLARFGERIREHQGLQAVLEVI